MAAPDHYELAPYPKGKFQNGHFFGERLVECAGPDIASLLAHFDKPPNDTWPYPWGGWSQSALCYEAEVQPAPGGQVTSDGKPYINYGKAHIHLKYATKPMFDVGGYRLWEEVKAGLQAENAGRGLLYWADNTPLSPGGVPIEWRRAALTYYISHFKLDASPASIATLTGCVNSSLYQTASLGYNFAPGTLLCWGADVSRGSPGALTSSWKQARWKFTYHPNGWNKIPRLETGQYEDVYKPNGQPWLAQTPAAFTYVTLRT